MNRRKSEKCPECKKRMEYHPNTCTGFFGNITEGEHWFCPLCNIEMLSNGKWRYGR